jgi:dienelactone hydrolase
MTCPRPGPITFFVCVLILLLPAAGFAQSDTPSNTGDAEFEYSKWADVKLGSLDDLSVPTLRSRRYQSELKIEEQLGSENTDNDYSLRFSSDGSPAYNTYLASYRSDGNRIYTRIDVPASPVPEAGYPVVIFVHGWYGREAAPGFDFSYQADSQYSELIDTFVDAGYLVLYPGLRGHGTVRGIPADGIEFLEAWDNGSYLGPMWYAIDVLNLVEGLHSLEDTDWSKWGYKDRQTVRVDTSTIHITGTSQGGDVALTALAVSGEGSSIHNAFTSGSIWSGCFGPRFEQVKIYGPMATTLEAFMSGDGTWTGNPLGTDGSLNPNFVFAWPSDWIGTVDTASPGWTWQAQTWSVPTVAQALEMKFSEMYAAVNTNTSDIDSASFEVITGDSGKATVKHDPRIEEAMREIGGFHFSQFLTEPLLLHHSDQDYYSIPRWNANLSERVNAKGGRAVDFTYTGNNHSLLASKYAWFNQGEALAGFETMLARDLAMLRGEDPRRIHFPVEHAHLTSIAALREYAGQVEAQFTVEYERNAIDGVNARVVNFTADGLKQYALVLEPAGERPDSGWPVMLVNHGHHPEPPNYGRIKDGTTDRPGDYYRDVPLAFARRGFLVVAPDFRGHNISEGAEFTGGRLESHWYARDTIAAFSALATLPGTDLSRVFLWGHSMGGDVTLRVSLAFGPAITGASIWSTAATADATLYRDALDIPLVIQHAKGDPVARFNWSESLATGLDASGKPHRFYPYEGDEHMFRGIRLEQAIDRDLAYFRTLVQPGH